MDKDKQLDELIEMMYGSSGVPQPKATLGEFKGINYTPKPTHTMIELEEYIEWVSHIPIVKKAEVLFDDRPHEVSIRVEYHEGLFKMDPDILNDSNRNLTKITSECRIKGCQRIILSYLQKEVIE